MKIPGKITIGEKKYTIRMRRRVSWLNKNVLGQINYTECVLTIKSTGSDRDKEELLFHEIAHGVLKELEYNHPSIIKFRNDEMFVQELGLLLRKTLLELLQKQRAMEQEARPWAAR